MNKDLLILFIVLNIVNVIVQTVKSLATVKGGKAVAAIVNAFAFGLYTIVTVYMMCDLPLFWKAGIVALCNLVGVFVVKWIEEKLRKDKLWKIEATIPAKWTEDLHEALVRVDIPHNYYPNVGKYTVFNLFCETQAESSLAKGLLDFHNAKYFVSESKIL